MGWFNDQLRERHEADDRMLEDAFEKAAGVVLGQRTAQSIRDAGIAAASELEKILRFYHYKSVNIPSEITETDEQISYCLRQYGIMRREVRLPKGWYRDAYGPMLAFTKEGHVPVALLPGKIRGYTFTDPASGLEKRVNRKNEDLFEEALCFYRPLPLRKIGIPDLLLFLKNCLSLRDIVFLLLASLGAALTGMMLTNLTRVLTGPVLDSGNKNALLGLFMSMICVVLTSQMISGIREMVMMRLQSKTHLAVDAAMVMRLLSLPAGFFRQYSAGELANRSGSVNSLCSLLLGLLTSTALTSVFSLLYIGQIQQFAPALVIPALISTALTLGFSILTVQASMRVSRQQMENSARESGLTYATLTGMQKIRLTGSEKRAFARWLDVHSDAQALITNPPLLLKACGAINMAISLFSAVVMNFIAAQSGVDPSSYYAFNAAYGMLSGAFMSLAGLAHSIASIKTTLEVAEPFLKTAPETPPDRKIITQISGAVELDHVSFRYDSRQSWLLDDVSLKIRPGEYVAITGRTGCGKSTLMRLLLGFEKPEIGSVSYDGMDLATLDLTSLRRKIGSVLQNGELFAGDLYSNIVISAPDLSVEDAWEAAEKAGIADDIRALPMGMHTAVCEGSGGLSGGQKQRLMIARAVAPRPKLLLLDEATSALDNKTQRQVSRALDAMGCTRIIIAHRLSTIEHCDRILVLDGGKIIEDGSYAELMAKGGFFAKLVERQRIDMDAE